MRSFPDGSDIEMSAHLRPLSRCQWYGCKKPATEELYNAVNAQSGVYCTPHAKRALREFQERFERETKGHS